MSLSEFDDRPTKKRRFFVEESPIIDRFIPTDAHALPSPTPDATSGTQDCESNAHLYPAEVRNNREQAFDSEMLASIVGETISQDIVKRLRELSGNDLQQAINIYLDGTWKNTINEVQSVTAPQQPVTSFSFRRKASSPPKEPCTTRRESSSVAPVPVKLRSMPKDRYIGAFGVAGWATRSGSGLVKHAEKVNIERTKTKSFTRLGKGGTVRNTSNKRQDIIVRFTNSNGEEVGRFENESSAWISALLDQKVCRLEGSVVFAPDRMRTNDTIYLQLRCYLLRSAFDALAFVKPEENNRHTGLFEAKESEDERNLRLRQVALVRLFEEINLQPSQANSMTVKNQRQGILKAAEVEDQKEQNAAQSKKQDNSGTSSPPSDDAEDGEELEQDQLDSLYKKAQSFDFNTPEAEPAKTFAMSLRKYQKQALHWMMRKEKDEKQEHKERSMHPLWEEYNWPTKDVDGEDLPEVIDQPQFYVNPYSGEMSLEFPVQEQNCLGGILADEMGLGKTIEMLSLIHSHTSRVEIDAESLLDASVNNLPRLPKNFSSVERAPRTTLVVAPMSLLAQWQSEAEKASKPGTLKVMVYYGSDKIANIRNLCCEANAATAPNVIITSYGVILSEFNQVAANNGNRGTHGGLFSVEYFRVILDEAHNIKNRQSKTAKACYEIRAKHRWVLTGTPIVNRLEDLFSLVRFLKVEPWSNFSFWKTFITVPFESKDFIRALDVVQTVLEPLVLRRTKDMKTPDGEALVPLPPRKIQIDHIQFSEAEKDVYDYIFTRAKRTFNANVEAGTVMKSFTTIFAQILRLRQSCCHPTLTRNKDIVADEEDAAAAADVANGLADDMDLQSLIARFTTDEEEQDANRYGVHVLEQIQDERANECSLCFEEPMDEQAVTGCWHSACKQCLLDYIEHQREKGESPRCFNCREPINARDVFEVVRHDPHPDDEVGGLTSSGSPTPRISLRRVGTTSSAKVSTLLSHLKRIRRGEPQAKSVVFSQFTSFLDLLGPALSRDRIEFVRFDGSLNQKQRTAVLTEFAESKKGLVLLLSLRAGGVGLNLTCANRVFMMDPWWSFAVESQAIDRVHRMGQEKEVTVHRFIVEGSIEEKMLKVQERKKFIASSLGMMSEEEKKVQRIEDIKELLS
ncbi:DNA repair protein, RAD5 [Patellaria atrata CBS 101060]|uniref:DNA repair protein, RAD5 n=1 Tax=Patellaria atrata CBS 101060 TaxID=1346257 RepID=A0A9P4SAU6_9PEZI|nr:DNA repair protein, RAD5 [Patellaria atrata CBS 101060]